jgi:hypothetical protein
MQRIGANRHPKVESGFDGQVIFVGSRKRIPIEEGSRRNFYFSAESASL